MAWVDGHLAYLNSLPETHNNIHELVIYQYLRTKLDQLTAEYAAQRHERRVAEVQRAMEYLETCVYVPGAHTPDLKVMADNYVTEQEEAGKSW